MYNSCARTNQFVFLSKSVNRFSKSLSRKVSQGVLKHHSKTKLGVLMLVHSFGTTFENFI